MLKIVLIGIHWVVAAMAGTVAGSPSVLCQIAEKRLQCTSTDPAFSASFLPDFIEPVGIWAAEENFCLTDRYGAYCWNWKDKKLMSFPSLAGSETLYLSETRVCGRPKETLGCFELKEKGQSVYIPEEANASPTIALSGDKLFYVVGPLIKWLPTSTVPGAETSHEIILAAPKEINEWKRFNSYVKAEQMAIRGLFISYGKLCVLVGFGRFEAADLILCNQVETWGKSEPAMVSQVFDRAERDQARKNAQQRGSVFAAYTSDKSAFENHPPKITGVVVIGDSLCHVQRYRINDRHTIECVGLSAAGSPMGDYRRLRLRPGFDGPDPLIRYGSKVCFNESRVSLSCWDIKYPEGNPTEVIWDQSNSKGPFEFHLENRASVLALLENLRQNTYADRAILIEALQRFAAQWEGVSPESPHFAADMQARLLLFLVGQPLLATLSSQHQESLLNTSIWPEMKKWQQTLNCEKEEDLRLSAETLAIGEALNAELLKSCLSESLPTESAAALEQCRQSPRWAVFGGAIETLARLTNRYPGNGVGTPWK